MVVIFVGTRVIDIVVRLLSGGGVWIPVVEAVLGEQEDELHPGAS